jgi:hypothetical protein
MIRYHSRRDLMEILPATIDSEHHDLQLAALERTFAFPASPWVLLGGPKLLAPTISAGWLCRCQSINSRIVSLANWDICTSSGPSAMRQKRA